MAPSKKSHKEHHQEKIVRRKEEKKVEDADNPKYRDRAKERREDQNPDYERAELGPLHAVAPPGNVELMYAAAHKISIENSKYLGGDVEHTHLVKGLDYALLHKIRSEIDKKPDSGDEADERSRTIKDDQPVSFRTATAKSVYQWIVKPRTTIKQNEMFLPGRMAFIFNMESGFSHDIPTTLHRSKADCPPPEEMVSVSVDGSVLDRIAKIMSYLRLGSSGKVLKKKKKEKDAKGRTSLVVPSEYENMEKVSFSKNNSNNREILPPPPVAAKKSYAETKEKKQSPVIPRVEEEDIFVGEGTDYEVPGKDILGQTPLSEDMEESPRNNNDDHNNINTASYFTEEPIYGPVPPSDPSQDWQQMNGYDDALQAQAMTGGVYQEYQYADQMGAYQDQYNNMIMQTGYDGELVGGVGNALNPVDPRFMTQEEKDRGLGSVFKRDDQRLQQLREKDAREKDPNFISESYSECYPGYQEYNREVVDSEDEDDLSKMDMGGRAKGRLHRWDFESEEEWATYNEQKEAMPKAAFQFGVKMQDGRKTRKQNKDQKLTNELHKINKILTRKKMDKDGGNDDGGDYNDNDDDSKPGKKIRV